MNNISIDCAVAHVKPLNEYFEWEEENAEMGKEKKRRKSSEDTAGKMEEERERESCKLAYGSQLKYNFSGKAIRVKWKQLFLIHLIFR